MKNKFLHLVFLLFLFASYSYSQPYQSVFGKDSTQWNVYGGNIDALFTKIFKCYSDTVIYKSLVYKVVYEYTDYMKKAAYLREDTLTGRLWNGEDIIMDLALNKNDTFFLGGEYAIVDSIYFKDNKKHIIFNKSLFSLYEKLLFIEGVGPNNNYHLSFDPIIGCNLLCSYKDTMVNYKNNNACFIIDYSIANKENNSLFIYPNPAINILFVEIQEPIISKNIFLINSNGILIKNISVCYGVNSFDISELNSGIYYIYYYTISDKIAVKSFIKI